MVYNPQHQEWTPADDTNLTTTSKSIKEIVKTTNIAELSYVNNWLLANKLSKLKYN